MKIKKLIVNTQTHKYPILIGSNLISNLPNLLNNNSIKFNKCLFLVDKNISKNKLLKIKKSFSSKKKRFSIYL